MATTELPEAPVERDRPARRLLPVLAIAVLAVVAVVLGIVVVHGALRGVPSFPSLQAAPDPTIHGTVAYVDDQSRCVRVIPAGGGTPLDVVCLPDQDPATAKELGKEVGPQLVWRPDGRLEVTMFRMTEPPGPTLNPGWQQVVDVRTGDVEETPAAELPRQPDLSTRPTVNAAGQRLSTTSTDDGHVRLDLTEPNGTTRTLLDAQGPGEYTYRLSSAFWAPDGQWIAADDGRILVVTAADPAVTRVLTDATTQGGFPVDDPAASRFAVTSADLTAA